MRVYITCRVITFIFVGLQMKKKNITDNASAQLSFISKVLPSSTTMNITKSQHGPTHACCLSDFSCFLITLQPFFFFLLHSDGCISFFLLWNLLQ